MIIKKIIKRPEKALEEQLAKGRDRNAELAGYGLLPDAAKQVVLNVPESSKYKDPNDNTCIGYWAEKAGYKIKVDLPYFRPACGAKMSMRDSTLDGAHVYKKGNSKAWYFVPLCSTCNNPNNTDEMTVDTVLVPVPKECYEKKEQE